jgi:D-alanyl-D-alanine carboxypeptidase
VLNGREVIQSAKESISSSNRKDVISASSYIVTSLDTSNKVLLEKNADTLLPLASVTKLVTAVVATRLMPADKQIEITKQMLATNGDTGRLRLGEKISVEELMYPLLMVSSNDAAEALARGFDRKKFIKEMNDWANSIGAYRTYFRDPSGLSVENVSTARDITIITKWIQENMPDIIAITATKSKTVRVHTWTNPTHFLNLSVYAGGKNGYTPEANRTGLALFKLGTPEKMYAVVLLGSSFRDEDTLDVLDLALKKM